MSDDKSLEERVEALEEIAAGVPERERKLMKLQSKGATIIETLGQIVGMIESLQDQLGDCGDGVQPENQQQEST